MAQRDRLVPGLTSTTKASRLLAEADTLTIDEACKTIKD